MKKIVFAFTLILLFGTGVIYGKKIKHVSFDDIVTVNPGAVTFKVEDVKIARDLLRVVYGADLGRKWANGEPYLGCSFANKSLVDGDNNAFSFKCTPNNQGGDNHPNKEASMQVGVELKSFLIKACCPCGALPLRQS